MQLIRTSLRLEAHLKKTAEKHALEEGTTLTSIVNHALDEFLKNNAKEKAQAIVFKNHDLGTRLDKLTRSDYYQ